MANSKKNTVLAICVSAFVLGMIIGGIGWDKNESTIPERTHGAVAMIVIGCIMIGGGLLGMYLIGGKTDKK